MTSTDKPFRSAHPEGAQLTQEQIERINKALATIKDFGEVHLIIQNGVLKYINVLNSHKVDEPPEEDE